MNPINGLLKGSTGCLGLPFMRPKRKNSVAKRHSVGASLFQFPVLTGRLRLCMPFLTVHGPSHEAFDFYSMHARECLSIR